MSERVRIARVIARLNVGGPATHVALLTARLPQARFETRLFSGRVAEGEVEALEVLAREGVVPERVPELGRSIRAVDDITALARLVAEFRRFKPHIVHTHTAKAGALGRLAARLARVPHVVHTFHGHVFEGYFSPALSRACVAVERALGRITHTVVTISPRQHAEITDKFRIVPKARVRTIQLGLDLGRFRDCDQLRGELHQELGLDPNVPLAACVGRLTAIKDHALLFRAVAELSRPLDVLVVGGGEDFAELKALATQLGLRQRLHFLGFRDDLPRILAASALVVLTSKNEGTPVALIEGLAAGSYPVAVNVGGVSDVLEGGTYGRLVNSREPTEFARALEAVLGSEAHWSSPARAARREYALGKYDVARLVADHVALYETLLVGGRESRGIKH